MLLTAGCDPEKTNLILETGDLNYLYSFWNKEGRPNTFDPSRHIISSDGPYFIYTNTLYSGTNIYHCCLGLT